MLVVKALRYADKLHTGQVRKGDGREYISHPIGCSYLLQKYKPNSHRQDELIAAMILHDVLEDCGVSFMDIATETTPLVASLVLELTNDEDMIKEIGKFEYQLKKMRGMSSWGLTLKLIDMLYNSSDSPSEKRKAEIIAICENLKQTRILTKTQNQIVLDIIHPLVELK
jgi:(p)ppGpp synthase/HD superfamily hydrolase